MKHLILVLSFLFAAFAATPAMAQEKTKAPAQRAAHISQILCLDDATAAQFCTLYAQYSQEMRAARQKYARTKPQKSKDGGSTPLTDEQVKANIEKSLALSQAILDIRKKYYTEFLKILTPRQIERLYELEKKDGEKLREMAKKEKKRNK